MSGMIDELVLVLEKQAECFDYLLGLSYEKREIIIKNDLDELQKITGLENTLITQNVPLDKKRAQIMKDMGMVLNIRESELTLTAILEKLENKPFYDELSDVSKRIRETVEKLKLSNDQNKTLIDNSLEYIDYTMNYLSSSGTPENYSDSKSSTGGNMFDTKQ